MGYNLMRRILADERLQRVAKEHRILAVILADHAHDGDERPCCWLSPAELTRELEGSNDAAAARRFRRSVDALIDAQIVKRADEPHDGRPKSRECPSGSPQIPYRAAANSGRRTSTTCSRG